MKLSDAIILGSTTSKMQAANINSCAYGCALNALGVAQDTIGINPNSFRYEEIKRLWPWTASYGSSFSREACHIWHMFDDSVIRGKMTLEQLVEYVKSVEPQCGECNQFKCTCNPVIETKENVYVNVSK